MIGSTRVACRADVLIVRRFSKEATILDRFLSRGLTITVLGLITVSVGTGLVLLMGGWSATLDGQWQMAGGKFLLASVALWSARWLCLNREELAG